MWSELRILCVLSQVLRGLCFAALIFAPKEKLTAQCQQYPKNLCSCFASAKLGRRRFYSTELEGKQRGLKQRVLAK